MSGALSSSAIEADEPQHKEQNQNFNLHNKFKTYDQYKLRQVAAMIAENVGFSTASNSSLSVLSSLYKVYLENLCRDTAGFAFHDSRDGNKIALEDVSRIFEKFSINLGELHDYLGQVENFALKEEVPLFPVSSTLTEPADVPVQQEQPEIVNKNIEVANDLVAGKEDDKEIGEREKSGDNQDQKNNLRAMQRIFPNFSNNFAQELGFIVKKVIPPTLEINIEQHLIANPIHQFDSASLSIIRQDHIIGPMLNLRVQHQNERHKEKKKKKKEKREQNEFDEGKEDKERKKHHHHHHKEKETKLIKEAKEPDGIDIQKDLSPPMKVPKIKIRIGPGPSPNQESLENSNNLPSTSTSSISSSPSKNNIHSPIKQTAAEHNKEEINVDEQKSPPRPSPMKNAAESPKKGESIISKTPLLVPPLRIVKSPPEKGIQDKNLHLNKLLVVELKSSNVTPKQQMEEKQNPQQQSPPLAQQEKTASLLETPRDSTIQTILPSSISLQSKPTSAQKPTEEKEEPMKISVKKRSRKSEKPNRVDPIMASLFHSIESSSPPGNPPIESKALESVIAESKAIVKKQKMNEPKKLSEPPMAVTEIKKEKSGRSSAQANVPIEIAPSNKTKMKSKSKMSTTPNSNTPISKVLPATPKTPHQAQGEDEGEEDVWICPVCSVAYVDNGPSMVGCDGCDKWFHWGCVGIFIPPPENAPWFCSECKKKKQKKPQQQQGGNGGAGIFSSRKSSVGGPPTKKQRRPSK